MRRSDEGKDTDWMREPGWIVRKGGRGFGKELLHEVGPRNVD